MKKASVVLVLAALATVAAAAQAGLPPLTFNDPPETNPLIPPGGWAYPYPYQRNVMLDFLTDPFQWPDDPNAPGARDLIPGQNYQTAGTHDPWLHESDWFTWADIDGDGQQDDPDWFLDEEGSVDEVFPGREGFFGLSGSDDEILIAWQLDNIHNPDGLKHVYVEMEYFEIDDARWTTKGILDSEPPVQVVDGTTETVLVETVDVGGEIVEIYRFSGWTWIEPNPLYEVIGLSLEAQSGGGAVYIDYIHIATECIPEPAGLGLIGLAMLAVRRRR